MKRTPLKLTSFIFAACLLTIAPASPALAQSSSTAPNVAGAVAGIPEASPEDVASIEAIVAATYGSISRVPGENFDWERMESLFLPDVRLIANPEQTGGAFLVQTFQEYRDSVDDWIAENAPIGSQKDKGFEEEQIHAEVERYGDIAHVMSTYQKRFWNGEEVLGRGINSFQLVRHDGRWWVVGIIWDEENGAGPIPDAYLPE